MKRSPLLVIFTTVFIDLIGFGIVIPVLPFYVEGQKFHATPSVVGFLFASYSVMQLVFTPILGRLSDRYGRRPILLYSIIGTGVAFLILGLASSVWMLFLGRILDGITGGNISTAQAYIADVTTPENRAKGMGMIGAAFGLGFIFGPAIGGVLSRWGISVPFFFASALAFSNAVLLYFTLPETVTPDHPARALAGERGFKQVVQSLKQSRLAVALGIYFLFITAFSIITTSFALFTMFRFKFDALHNGYLFAMVGVIGAFIQGVLIGKLTAYLSEAMLVIAGALLFSISVFMFPFIGPVHGGLPALLAVIAVFAIGNSLATPALTSIASRSVGAGEQGSVLGVSQSVASLGRVIGPTLGGLLIYSATAPLHMDDRSLFVTFWTAAGIMLGAFLLAIYFAKAYSLAQPARRPEADLSAVG